MNQTITTTALSSELRWLGQRIEQLLDKNTNVALPLPPIGQETPYGKLISEYGLSDTDRVLLCLAFASTFQPAVLTPFALLFARPEKKAHFGGIFSEAEGQFYPTLRTAVFILAGGDEELTDYYISLFHPRHILFTSNILLTATVEECKIFLNHQLIFNDQFIPVILQGEAPRLDGDAGFPARRGKRSHILLDVVLDNKTTEELKKLQRFARNMKKLWALPESSKYRQNFIGIFSGDPGTGKSHTAEAIGNELNLPVYKVNFAQLVSKYIGETEKNLERIFDRFSGQPSILFFDEAESIFSKRIEVKDSHDKHSNNEQSYLLQKIEEYNGIVILATNVQNLSHYFDKAFQRRIRQIISFPFPEYAERLRLWENALGKPFSYEAGLVEKLAKSYQLSGGGIYNVVSEGIIEALDRDVTELTFSLLEQALADEFKKTGRKFEACTDEQVIHDPARRHGPGYEQRKNF